MILWRSLPPPIASADGPDQSPRLGGEHTAAECLDSISHVLASDEVTMALEVRKPITLTVPWVEAHQRAEAELEPVFVPISPYADDRGWSLMNLLAGAMSEQGQINFSMQYPGVVKAWHRHDKQTDFWICAIGHIKAGMWRESDGVAWMCVFGNRNPGVLIIPPPLWHGAATVGPESAGLLYYVTRAYDAAHPDEYRRPWDSVEGFPWATRHG